MRLTTRLRTWLRWAPAGFFALVLARLVWLGWTAASRGVDFTDEGIYLVSYRYYRNPEMVYNGAPAFFGPLFGLVGYSVVALRRIKLVLVVICGLGLGWSTAVFVRPWRAAASPLAELPARLAIVLFVTIGGFTMYTWLPQSPGYNDLSVLCAMVLAAVILPLLVDPWSRRRWWLGAAGAVVGLALVNKWPAGLCMAGVTAVALVVALGWRGAGRGLGWSAAGLVAGWAVLAVVSGSFFDRLTELRSASEQLSSSLPVWDSYLVPYWRNVVDVAGVVGVKVWLMLALGVGLALVAPMRRTVAVGALLSVGVVLVVRSSSVDGLFRGGTENVGSSQVALPMLLVLAGVVWLVARATAAAPTTVPTGATSHTSVSARGGGAAVLLLIGLAGAQAFGSLNPLMFVVVSSGALCAAAMVIVASSSVMLSRQAILPVVVLLIALPLATERMMLSGLWQHPYRLATNLYAQNTRLDDVIGYDGLSLDSGTAQLLGDLSAIADRRGLAGRPGLSVSSSPGYALALGLIHPPADLFISSADYFPGHADVYQARLRTACSRGLITPDDPPVIVTAGPLAPDDIGALLAECGISFPADFELELAENPAGSIGVWIPNGRG